MSVQFGKWNFDRRPVTQEYLDKVGATLAPYGPDSNDRYSKDGVAILYRAFHTTTESHLEVQPHISPSGAVITWDGRLDNRKELIIELRDSLTADRTDVALVAAAYERWGNNCLGKFVGDWAVSIWNRNNRSLLLAKDPIGTRHLYYWMAEIKSLGEPSLTQSSGLLEGLSISTKSTLPGGFRPCIRLFI